MFKKFISILIILFLILQVNFSFASNATLKYTQDVRWKIIDNFKEEQYKNIFKNENNVLLSDEENVNFFETINKNEKYEKIREKLLESKEEVSQKKDNLTTRRESLESTIAELDKEIQTSTEEISSLNREVLKLSWEVTDLEAEVSELQKEIDDNKKILLDYIGHIYKKQNIVFDWEEIDSIKTILLNNWNISDVLNDIHFSSIIEVTGQTLMEKHRKLVRQLFVKKLDLQTKIDRLKLLRKQEVVKRKALLEKKDFRQKILDYTKWQESVFEAYLKEKEASDKKMQIRILQNKIIIKEQKEELLTKFNCNYIDFDNLSIKDLYLLHKSDEKTKEDYSCLDLNKILNAEAKLKWFPSNVQNVLSWPVTPIRWLSAYYKDPDYTDVVWATHDAIDIRAEQWTDILAPADWYVTFLKAPTDEWYAYIVLKHADGFVTVYGHISDVFVKDFDFVKKWEAFAKTGWELWTNWAWIMTTWPHLHFEVYKDKEYVDPLNYLDLTELWEWHIPDEQKYIYKFIDDYRVKNWVEYEWELVNEASIFKLEWDSEVDRQKDLLTKYASWEFQDWNVWVEEAIDWNLDPSFVMCIWLAETWLWRNLKTPYNVWNVWNTDSWEVKDFMNARSWVYWIVRTLNNKFLWKYDKLNQLSRYWNKSWTIYASSPLNWHRNITRCLSALKEKSIPDDFNFRVGN